MRIRIRRWALAVPVVAGVAITGTLIVTTPAQADAPAIVGNTDGDGLVVREEPNTTSGGLATLNTGDTVNISCQTRGEPVENSNGWESDLWDYSTELGGYVADAYMDTGHDGPIPGVPECEDDGDDGGMVEGFDNSNNNEGTIDFATAGQQFGFAIMKASESTDFVDAFFVERFQAAQGNMDAIGAYHFFDPRTDGVAQAEHNLAVLAEAGYDVAAADTLPIMVDVEPNYVEPGVGFCFDTDAATMNQRLADYVEHITNATGQAPMVYTNGEMVNDCGLDTAPLTDQPLVVPAWEQWNADPQQTAQALGWDSWTFWQYDSYITVPGGVGALADRFNGDADALAALAAA